MYTASSGRVRAECPANVPDLHGGARAEDATLCCKLLAQRNPVCWNRQDWTWCLPNHLFGYTAEEPFCKPAFATLGQNDQISFFRFGGFNNALFGSTKVYSLFDFYR